MLLSILIDIPSVLNRMQYYDFLFEYQIYSSAFLQSASAVASCQGA
jgi:hypothetical protein